MKWFNKFNKHKLKILSALAIISLLVASFYFLQSEKFRNQVLDLTKVLNKTKKELNDFKNQDQVKINEQLKIDLKKTHDAYSQLMKPYEKIQDLKAQKQDVKDLEKTYAEILQSLSDLNYSSGSALLAQLNSDIDKKVSLLAAAQTSATSNQTATISNTPPGKWL